MPVQILYVLDMKGNIKQALADVQDGLKRVGAESDRLRDIGSNGAELFGEFFGEWIESAYQLADATGELATAVGGFTGIAIGAATATAVVAAGAVFAAKSTKDWLDEVVELRKQLVQQSVLTKDEAKNIEEYEKASKRLTAQLNLLQVELGNELAPTFTYYLDVLVGGISKVDQMVSSFGGLEEALRKQGEDWKQLADIIDYNKGAADDFLAVMKVISTGGGSLVADWASGLMGSTDDLAAAGRATQSDVPWEGSVYGPTPEQLLGIDQDRFDRAVEKALEKRQGTEFGFGVPGSVEEMEASIEFARYWQAEVVPALQQIAGDTQVASDDLQVAWRDLLASIEGTGPSFLQTAQGITSGLGTGSVSGFLGATGVAVDPVSALVLELIGLIKDPSALFELFGEVFDLYMNLDEWVGALTTGLIEQIISNLPEMAAAFTVLGPAVALALVDAAPALFAAVIDALFELPSAFADAIARTLVQGADALNPFNDDVKLSNPFARGGALATHFGEGSDSFLGFNIGTFASGGAFHTDGLAYVHGGEVLLNRDQQRSVMGGGTTHVTVNMYGVQDMDRFVEDLQNKLGPYGFNLSLSPRVP